MPRSLATRTVIRPRTRRVGRRSRGDTVVSAATTVVGRSAAARLTKHAPARGSGARPPTSHSPQGCEDALGVLVDQLSPMLPEAFDQTLSPPGPDVTDRHKQHRGSARHPSDPSRTVGGLVPAYSASCCLKVTLREPRRPPRSSGSSWPWSEPRQCHPTESCPREASFKTLRARRPGSWVAAAAVRVPSIPGSAYPTSGGPISETALTCSTDVRRRWWSPGCGRRCSPSTTTAL